MPAVVQLEVCDKGTLTISYTSCICVPSLPGGTALELVMIYLQVVGGGFTEQSQYALPPQR